MAVTVVDDFVAVLDVDVDDVIRVMTGWPDVSGWQDDSIRKVISVGGSNWLCSNQPREIEIEKGKEMGVGGVEKDTVKKKKIRRISR